MWTGRTAAEFLASASESTLTNQTKTGEGCVCMYYRWKPSKDKKIRIKRYKANSWEKGLYNWVFWRQWSTKDMEIRVIFFKYLCWFYLRNIKYLENCNQQIVSITRTSSTTCTMGFYYGKILLWIKGPNWYCEARCSLEFRLVDVIWKYIHFYNKSYQKWKDIACILWLSQWGI